MSFGVCIGNESVSIAVWQDERPVTVVNQAGHRTTAAAISYSEGEVVVGDTAKGVLVKRGPREVLHTLPYVFAHATQVTKVRSKRLGCELIIEETETECVSGFVAYSDNSDESGQNVTFEEAFSHIFKFCKREVESYLGTPVTGCVVVLADELCDNPAAVGTIAKAADSIGLEVERVLRPSTAALLAALPNLDSEKATPEKILVVDIGALHTTVTAVSNAQGTFNTLDRKSVDVGGRDFDKALCDHFAGEFRRKTKLDITDDKRAQRKLSAACEQAKKTMSSRSEGLIQIEALSEGMDLASKIARGRYESLIMKYVPTVVDAVVSCAKASGFPDNKPDVLVFIGGGSNTQIFRTQISSAIGSDVPVIATWPEEITALGAATQSNICQLSGVGVPVGGVWQKAAKGTAGKENDSVGIACSMHTATADIGIKSASGDVKVLIPAGSLLPIDGKAAFAVPEAHAGGIVVEVVEGTETICTIPLKQLASKSVNVTLAMASNSSISATVSDGAGNKATASIPAAGA